MEWYKSGHEGLVDRNNHNVAVSPVLMDLVTNVSIFGLIYPLFSNMSHVTNIPESLVI